jgi:hypothetical protein
MGRIPVNDVVAKTKSVTGAPDDLGGAPSSRLGWAGGEHFGAVRPRLPGLWNIECPPTRNTHAPPAS